MAPDTPLKPDRLERHLMRQRGAGVRSINSNFGFSLAPFDTVQSQHTQSQHRTNHPSLESRNPEDASKAISTQSCNAIRGTLGEQGAQEQAITSVESPRKRRRYHVFVDEQQDASAPPEKAKDDTFVKEARPRRPRGRPRKVAAQSEVFIPPADIRSSISGKGNAKQSKRRDDTSHQATREQSSAIEAMGLPSWPELCCSDTRTMEKGTSKSGATACLEATTKSSFPEECANQIIRRHNHTRARKDTDGSEGIQRQLTAEKKRRVANAVSSARSASKYDEPTKLVCAPLRSSLSRGERGLDDDKYSVCCEDELCPEPSKNTIPEVSKGVISERTKRSTGSLAKAREAKDEHDSAYFNSARARSKGTRSGKPQEWPTASAQDMSEAFHPAAGLLQPTDRALGPVNNRKRRGRPAKSKPEHVLRDLQPTQEGHYVLSMSIVKTKTYDPQDSSALRLTRSPLRETDANVTAQSLSPANAVRKCNRGSKNQKTGDASTKRSDLFLSGATVENELNEEATRSLPNKAGATTNYTKKPLSCLNSRASNAPSPGRDRKEADWLFDEQCTKQHKAPRTLRTKNAVQSTKRRKVVVDLPDMDLDDLLCDIALLAGEKRK